MTNDNSDSLQSLYPFLSGKGRSEEDTVEALLNSVQQKSADSVSVKQHFFATQAKQLVDAAKTLATTYSNGGRLFSMGNGGSSCDAAHVAVEFQHPVTTGRPSLPAMHLGNDMAMISAVANDVGIAHVFTRQIEAHGQKGDTLIGFSTSGNSENIMAAFHKAKSLGINTIGFAGHTGGEMKSSGILDHCLVVETDSIHRVQETHLTCYHILWDLVHTMLADQRGNLGQSL